MIAAIITDYERAVLDALRGNRRLRELLDGMDGLPATAESAAHTREIYDNKWRAKHGRDNIPEKQAAQELALHEARQEEFRLYYKTRGYKPPYEYGKGLVKVLMQIPEEREPEEQAAGAEGKIVPIMRGKHGRNG